MKKVLSTLVAFSLTIAPLNSFAQSLSVIQTSEKNNVGLIAGILAATLLVALIISSSSEDQPVSP